jgi:hypothetical protein
MKVVERESEYLCDNISCPFASWNKMLGGAVCKYPGSVQEASLDSSVPDDCTWVTEHWK